MVRSACRVAAPGSEFAGFRFPPEVITLAVRWYLRFGLSYRDVEELLAERGIEVDHTTLFRRVAQFTPLFTEWRSLYRAIDRFGQVIDVLVARKRDKTAARRFLTRALAGVTSPTEVTTDRAPAYPRVVEDMLPGAVHVTVKYAYNRIEADHGRLKARLRPMRGMKRTDRCGSSPPGTRSSRTCAADTTNSPPTPPPVIEWRSRSPSSPSRSDRLRRSAASGRPPLDQRNSAHAFVQNLRRGHYKLATEAAVLDRVAAAFTELAVAI